MAPQVGDIVFAHSSGMMGKAIRFGERLQFKRGSFYNHVCIVDRIVDGVAYVVQAEPRGVTNDKTLESVGTVTLITPPAHVDVEKMLTFARAQVGSKYGFMSIVSIVVDVISWDWFPAMRARGTWICSALTAESLRYGGWFHNWPDIYIPKPSDVYNALVV